MKEKVEIVVVSQEGWFLVRVIFKWKYEGKGSDSSSLKRGVILVQGLISMET